MNTDNVSMGMILFFTCFFLWKGNEPAFALGLVAIFQQYEIIMIKKDNDIDY